MLTAGATPWLRKTKAKRRVRRRRGKWKKGLINFTMFEDTLALRTVKTGAVAAVCLTLLLFSSGHLRWAGGFLIGAILSLFSVFSLMIVVPFLVRPGAPSYAPNLLA